MEHVQRFVELAVQGRWREEMGYFYGTPHGEPEPGWWWSNEDNGLYEKWEPNVQEVLLSPDAWRAVGNVLGWEGFYHNQIYRAGKPTSTGGERLDRKEVYPRWTYEMHHFIDLLAEGKDLNTALGEIIG